MLHANASSPLPLPNPFPSPATSISASQSQILVDGLTEFFRSAAFASKRPLQLTKELRESSADIPDEQLGVLVEAWTKEGASVIRALKVESSSLTGGELTLDVTALSVYALFLNNCKMGHHSTMHHGSEQLQNRTSQLHAIRSKTN